MVAEMGRPREGVRERCAIGAHDGGRGTQRQAPSACAVCTGSGGTPRNEAIHAVLFSCPPVKTMAPSSSSPSSAEETSRAGRAPERRDRAQETASEPQPEATRAAETGAPTRSRVRTTPRESASGAAGQGEPPPPSLREHAVLELVTRLRLVPLALVHHALFEGVSRQVVGRFVHRMIDRGWLQTWSEPTERGGNPTWIYATAAGRTAGLGLVFGAAEGTPFQQLVATMLPSARTRPLELAPRIAPAFLRHQRETVTLLVRLAAAHGALWYSAWDRPLPQMGAPAQLPQPDGVLVLPGASGPELVFLEHDRGMESPAHFARAKAARYAELAVRPELCQRLLGFPTFRLAVTVENARLHRHPLERLGLLSRLLREAGAAREAVLSLAGWANAWPAGAVWCRAEDPFLPASRPAVELQEPALCHTLPCPPSGRGEPCACSAQRDPSRLLEVDRCRPCG